MLSQTSGIPEYIFAKQGGYDAEIKSAPFNWTYEVLALAAVAMRHVANV